MSLLRLIPLLSILVLPGLAAGELRVYKDPETGRFVPPPKAAAPAPAPEAALGVQVAPKPLVPTPAPVAEGGVMVDLNGRYRSYSRAVRQPDGRIGIECRQKTAAE